MDLGLQGRRAVIAPATSSLATSCAAALRAEGVELIPADRAEKADLVISIADFSPRGDPDRKLTTELMNRAWSGAVVEVAGLFRRALPHMKAQGFGRFVVVAPLAAKHVVENAHLDNIVALGLLGLQKTLSGEVGPHGVTANAVLWDGEAAPGGSSDVLGTLASTVAFLCSEPAAYLTGVAIAVDRALSPEMF